MADLFKNVKYVAAVRSEADIDACVASKAKIVFLLSGTLLSVPGYVKKLKAGGKTVFIHLDLMEGLSSSKYSVDYLHTMTEADGVISIKQNVLKYAKSIGMMTILRTFLLDSLSIATIEKINKDDTIDVLEVLPGIALTIIPEVVARTRKVIIGGGLIHTEALAQQILAAGAQAISTSDVSLWNKNGNS